MGIVSVSHRLEDNYDAILSMPECIAVYTPTAIQQDHAEKWCRLGLGLQSQCSHCLKQHTALVTSYCCTVTVDIIDFEDQTLKMQSYLAEGAR